MGKRSKFKNSLIWLLILKTTLSIPWCVQVSSSGECISCYNSKFNRFGTCTPNDDQDNCLIWEGGGSATAKCVKCKEGYFINQDKKCSKISPSSSSIKNCLNHYSEDSSSSDNLRCRECSDGYPNDDFDSCVKLTSDDCSSWEKYKSGDGSYKRDCTVCKKGSNYVFSKETRKCLQLIGTSDYGCHFISADGKCESCQAWNGYHADGYSESTGQICRKLGQHSFKPIFVLDKQVGSRPSLSNTSVSKILKKSSVKNYGETKGGSHLLLGNVPYEHYTKYTSKPRTLELYRCFFFAKACLILADVEELDEESQEQKLVQKVLLFNATDPSHQKLIFINTHASQGKFVSNLLPITNSPYAILGFSTTSSWTNSSDSRLVRIDVMNISRKFEYSLV